MGKKIQLYDSTLRDGTQAEEIAFSLEDKLLITEELDSFGIDYIEGGWPGSNPKDAGYFEKVKKLNLKHAKITAFGSTRRAGVDADKDVNLKMLVDGNPDAFTVFGKTWDLHVTDALKISLEENLEIVEDSISYLRGQGKPVFYDAEHFFDGYKHNPDYAIKVLQAAEKGGAEVLVLCDTNGGTLPNEVSEIIEEVKDSTGVPFGIHTHNDSELAVANSLIAIKQGAIQVQGTINGYGERCGNANLCSIIPALLFKMGYEELRERIKIDKLTQLSNFVTEIANLKAMNYRPYVGKSAFAHKGGIHVNAILKNKKTYEHIEPELVGNSQRVLVSDLSGRSNIEYKAEQFGIDINSKDPKIINILQDLKELENAGFVYEGAEASFKLLMLKVMGKSPEHFFINRLQVNVLVNDETITEAVIKLETPDGNVVHTAAEGNGPVNALDNALRKALEHFYPCLKEVKLVDFKVRILDETVGTEAKTRVLIESSDGENSWGTVGVSENIINAAWSALLDSICYKLLLEENKK
ncbi:MAG: citramalate synthase [Nitrospinae bacterium]|nr:citramalate synthase [Nitrospinota bacterium]